MNSQSPAISFVIPVRNGGQWLESVLQSVLAQRDGNEIEIILIDDGSQDRSREILEKYRDAHGFTIVRGPRRGAAAALNEGIRNAKHPIICQVDQDVILQPGWLTELTDTLRDPTITAAQGYYVTPRDGGILPRVMGLDLEDRYRSLGDRDVDHVCTGNTAYRAEALRAVGLFDETLGYGYDNDMSYRLAAAGYRLVIRPRARSLHRWRDGLWGYLRQQYGFGYGRIDLVAKHRAPRVRGDTVSNFWMMMHGPLMAVALMAVVAGVALAAAGAEASLLLLMGAGIIAGLGLERLVAGVRAMLMFRDPAGLLFPPVHLMRDLAWVAAMLVWAVRRLRGVKSLPADSMHPRPVARRLAGRRTT